MARKDISNILMTVGSGRIWPCPKMKRIMVTAQGRKEVEVATLLLGSDKNNVIANRVQVIFSV